MRNMIAPESPSGQNPNSLLKVAREVPADEVDWEATMGWQLRSQCPAGGIWCCGDTNMAFTPGLEKADPSAVTTPKFFPFMAYQVAGCGAGTSRTPANTAEAQRASEDWLTANAEGWLSRMLETGPCTSPGLNDLSTVTGGTVTLNRGIVALIEARRTAGLYDRPTLHIPDWFAATLDDNVWVRNVANIVLAPGYGTDSAIVEAAGEAWIYITGPVEYAFGARRQASGIVDGLELRRQNSTWELSELIAIYRFDPCGGFKVLVNSTP